MALEEQEKTIGDRRYIVPNLPGMAGLTLFARLCRIAGSALAVGFDGDVGKGLGLLFEKLDETESEALVRKICDNIIVIENGAQHPMMKGFDLTYAGGEGLIEVFQVVKFALEVQFGPTFAALLAARAALPAAATPAASA